MTSCMTKRLACLFGAALLAVACSDSGTGSPDAAGAAGSGAAGRGGTTVTGGGAGGGGAGGGGAGGVGGTAGIGGCQRLPAGDSQCSSRPALPAYVLCRYPFTAPAGCDRVLVGDTIEGYCCSAD